MKKITYAVVLIFTLLSCASCQQEGTENQIRSLPYEAKTVVETNKDGWVTYLSHEYDAKDYNYWGYDAYNLKHKYIDGYEGKVLDAATGEIVETITPSLPYLSCNSELEEETIRVGDYFVEKNFLSAITEADLADLHVEKVDKTNLVRMFNQVITSDPLPDGRYIDYPEANIVTEQPIIETVNFTNGWQVGYYLSHGVIMVVRIDFLKDGEYLSDGGEHFGDNGSDAYAKVQKIEQNIVQQQCFNVDFDETADQGIDFQKLRVLLQAIERGDRK